jgi:hypothetical protein
VPIGLTDFPLASKSIDGRITQRIKRWFESEPTDLGRKSLFQDIPVETDPTSQIAVELERNVSIT